jgi:lipopolysaccharide export system permease protein
MRIKSLDLYVLGEILGPFAGGVIFFLFMFLMSRILLLADFLILHGVPIGLLMKMVALMNLSFLPLVLPVAFLIAVLIGFGRLSADSELVAMKACGLSVNRLAAPIVALGMIIVGLSLCLNLEWVPWSERTFKATYLKVGNTKVVSSIREGAFTSGFFDLLIFADKVDSKTNRLKRVFIFDEREPKNPLTVVAETGEVTPIKTSTDLGAAAVLKLYNGSIHHSDLEENSYQKIKFGEYKLFLKVEEAADGSFTKPAMISFHDLLDRIHKNSTATYEGREMRGELWRRVAIAISPLLFVLLGIGFGTVRTRAVRASAALVAFITLVIYWSVQTAATIAIQRAIIPPVIAMELPNLLVLIAGVFSYRRAMW